MEMRGKLDVWGREKRQGKETQRKKKEGTGKAGKGGRKVKGGEDEVERREKRKN